MFKIYSKGCEYVVRALTLISSDNYEVPFLAKELCEKANVPESSTRKAFQGLVRDGLLTAVPGPGGGYKLSKDPKKISLLDVITAVDGKNVFEKCIMGLPECCGHEPCPVHNTWVKVKRGMLNEMKEKTLHQLMKSVMKAQSQ